MGCTRVVVWLVSCVCVGVSTVEGDGLVWVGRCASGRCRCVYVSSSKVLWVWGGVLLFVVMVWDGVYVFLARCVACWPGEGVPVISPLSVLFAVVDPYVVGVL